MAARTAAVAFVEWSGILQQKTVIDWTVISNDETAHQFGDHIVEAPRAFANSTSISAGIDFAVTQLDQAPYEARRRVIDVSGDGDNNGGRDVTAARDEVIAKGVTINGLVILTETPTRWNSAHTNPAGGLANYYRNNVIGGPGAFVMVAENFNSFSDVLVKKLIAEIAQAVPHDAEGFLLLPELSSNFLASVKSQALGFTNRTAGAHRLTMRFGQSYKPQPRRSIPLFLHR